MNSASEDDVLNEAFEMLVDDELESFVTVTIAEGEIEMVWQEADVDGQPSLLNPPHTQLMIGHAIASVAEVTGMDPEDVARGALELAGRDPEGVNIDFTSESGGDE